VADEDTRALAPHSRSVLGCVQRFFVMTSCGPCGMPAMQQQESANRSPKPPVVDVCNAACSPANASFWRHVGGRSSEAENRSMSSTMLSV
jgi:hypothetical protein